jgi:predicted ATPase
MDTWGERVRFTASAVPTYRHAVEICLLGSLEVFAGDGTPLPIAGHRVQVLLVALALHCGEVVTDDSLIDAVWGQKVPDRGENALQRQISRLRSALGSPDAVVRRGSGYALNLPQSAVDIFRFDRLAARGHEALREGDANRACELLDEALGLWRGVALTDVAYEEFAQPEIARLTEARLVATEARVDADLALGRDAALIGELEQLVAAHPLREHLRAQLMLALSRSGRQADALRAYQNAREVLAVELGLEPSPELRALESAILQQDQAVVRRRTDAPSGRSRTNLRTPLTRLIGRKPDMDALRPHLETHRLVTLVGPGGVGKSRLALEAAHEYFARGDGEVWMVELADVTHENDVLPAMMRAIDLPRGGDEGADIPRLIEYCCARPTLLVLDNCEHLLAAVARAAQDLLESCPGVCIWTTSREGLGVPSEVLWAVPPLALDDAVELFVERGRAADPTSQISADSSATNGALVDICTRLDCLPLAIELAAARLRAMPMRELASGLEDRFRTLNRGARTALPRQQTLRAVVDWSYDLLFDDERLVFDRLSVFRGSCSLAAARVVCADDEISGDDVAELVSRLVDKSLVVLEIDEFEGYGRCHMLQTLVDYGRERLEESGDAARVSAAHAWYYTDFAVRSIAALRGYRQRGWLRAVAANMTNLRAVLDIACSDGDAETAYSIAGSLSWFWWFTGRDLEASQWLGLARSCPGSVSDLARARVLAWMVFANSPGLIRWGEAGGPRQTRAAGSGAVASFEEMDRLCHDAVVLYEGVAAPEELAGVEIALSVTYSMRGALERAAELLAHAEALLASAEQEPAVVAMRTFAAGRRAYVEDRYADADGAFRESIELLSHQAIDVHCSLALRYAARLAAIRGDHAAAISDIERALIMTRRLGLPGSTNQLLGDLGESLGASGAFDRARAVLGQLLTSAREVGFLRGISESLTGLALTEWRADDADLASSYASEGLEAALQIDHFESAIYCLVVLGWAASRRGDPAEAHALHVRSLQVATEQALPRGAAFALESLAGVSLLEKDGRKAAWLLGAASALRRTRGAAVGVAFAVGARYDTAQPLSEAATYAPADAVAGAFSEGARDPQGVVAALTTELTPS